MGGGIAGLACARALSDAGRSFMLITEDIGGRVRASADGKVNLGAYYVRADYHHVNQFVDRGRRIRRRDVICGHSDGSFSRLGAPLLTHPREAVRFLLLLRRFHRYYGAFQRACVHMQQEEALAADPVMWGLYHEPAQAFIQRHRLETVSRSVLAPAAQATAFASPDRLTALALLFGALPTIVPMYEYVFRFDRLTRGFEDSISRGTVVRVTSHSGYHSVETTDGEAIEGQNLVVATPADVSARLLGLEKIKAPIGAHLVLVRGVLREPWSDATCSLFPEGDAVCGIARQADGRAVVCTMLGDPDFERCFASWDVEEHHHWNQAFHLEGSAILSCEQGPGLYLIGDHNVCNLEDAYITGVYAANQIIASVPMASPS